MAAAGISIGLLGAFVVTGSLADLLYGVDARDGATFGAVAVLLAVSVLLASYVPARRATRIDPTIALKGD